MNPYWAYGWSRRYTPHDIQQEWSVYHCACCQAEIYDGTLYYLSCGWQILCPACHDVCGQRDDLPLYAGYEGDRSIT